MAAPGRYHPEQARRIRAPERPVTDARVALAGGQNISLTGLLNDRSRQ